VFAYLAVVGKPAAAALLIAFRADAVLLAIVTVLLPRTWKRAQKYRRYFFSGGGILLLVALAVRASWIMGTLHRLNLHEATMAAVFGQAFFILWIVAVAFLLTAMSSGSRAKSKQGPKIRPLRVYDDEEKIVVGGFEPRLLPVEIRQFAAAEPGENISIPVQLLTRGIAILGDPGSGKSRLMRLLHDEVRRLYPNIPILIHDPKGEWLRTYYDPETDLIFAPYDKRSTSWDFFTEIKQRPELLASLVATAVSQHHSGGENAFWATAAAAIIQEQLETTNDLMSFRDGLIKWREAHSSDKTALSAYSSARPAIKDIATIALADGLGGKRTMEQFVNHRGRIFLLNSPMQTPEQSGAFAIFLSAFVLSCLSQPDTSSPRACAIIDEALTFHLPSALEQMVSAQSRSKGLVTIAGAQWIPKDERRLLTRAEFMFSMKVADLPTSKLLSDLVGHTIFDEETKSTSVGSASTSTNTSQQERRRETMPPEFFRTLPQRAFILLHQAGIAPGYTAAVNGEQHDNILAFDYQSQPLVSEYMKIL
jgi:hypothetical protein